MTPCEQVALEEVTTAVGSAFTRAGLATPYVRSAEPSEGARRDE